MSEEFIKAEMKLFAEQAIEVDIIITTALIPGREAPKLITSGMVESMREGSVIVDLASEQGGNCTLTKPNEKVVHHGVTILGYTDLPSRMAALSSRLYSAGIVHLLDEMGGKEAYSVDLENEIIRGALVLREGSIMWPPPKPKNPGPKYSVDTGLRPSKEEKVELKSDEQEISFSVGRILKYIIGLIVAVVIYTALKKSRFFIFSELPNFDFNDPFVERFIDQLTVFVLACFVGWQVIWNVKPALHTPLMSVTNAISGIIIIGGILQISQEEINASVILGAAAILLAAINVVGGFLVTNRMLAMFRQ